jgi:hypothetical protein
MPAQVRIGTIQDDFYVRTADLAGVLGVSDNELSQLYRSAILTRISDPDNAKAVLYPVFDSIRRYCEYRRSKRTVVHEKFLEEKAGRERATRLKVEMFNRERAGELVDKQKLISRLEPIIVAYREQMLARADRLERELTRMKSRKEKVAKLRAADLDALAVLSDLFKTLGKSEAAGNGAKAKRA